MFNRNYSLQNPIVYGTSLQNNLSFFLFNSQTFSELSGLSYSGSAIKDKHW